MTTESAAPMPAYQASGTGRRLRAWRPSAVGPNIGASADAIVSRVRDLVRNNPWAGASVDRYVSNAIATGIQAKAVNGTEQDRAAQDALWREWAQVADADGMLIFEAQQALAAREWKECGEAFARIRPRREEDGLPVPLQIQLIESEQCPRSYYGTSQFGNQIREGIEFNGIGRRVAYWMYRAHPGDAAAMMTVNGSELVRIPAEQIIHLYRPLRAGQLRGISDLTGVAVQLYNLDRISDNVNYRIQIGNLFAGFLESDRPGTDGVLGESRSSTDDDGTDVISLEPGTISELPAGKKMSFSTPPGAGTDYADFMRFGLLSVAARVGVPAELLTGDLRDVSDRALKLILLEFHRLIEMDLWLYFIPQFCQRIRDAWWDQAVLAGKLAAPDYATRPNYYRKTLWMPEGWPYSHPVQDVTADEKAIAAGLTSRSRLVLRRGEDPNEIDSEQAADNARADALGLTYTSDGRNATAAPPQQGNDQ